MPLPALLANPYFLSLLGGSAAGLGGYLGGRFGGEGLQDFLLGQPERIEQIQQYSPQAQNILQFLMQQGQQQYQNPYQDFDQSANIAREQFAQSTVPSIAARFAGLTGGATSSPSLQSQLGQAGAGLEQNLAQLRTKYGMEGRNQGLNALMKGITPQFQNFQVGAQPGLLQPLLGAAGQGFGYGLSSLVGK